MIKVNSVEDMIGLLPDPENIQSFLFIGVGIDIIEYTPEIRIDGKKYNPEVMFDFREGDIINGSWVVSYLERAKNLISLAWNDDCREFRYKYAFLHIVFPKLETVMLGNPLSPDSLQFLNINPTVEYFHARLYDYSGFVGKLPASIKTIVLMDLNLSIDLNHGLFDEKTWGDISPRAMRGSPLLLNCLAESIGRDRTVVYMWRIYREGSKLHNDVFVNRLLSNGCELHGLHNVNIDKHGRVSAKPSDEISDEPGAQLREHFFHHVRGNIIMPKRITLLLDNIKNSVAILPVVVITVGHFLRDPFAEHITHADKYRNQRACVFVCFVVVHSDESIYPSHVQIAPGVFHRHG